MSSFPSVALGMNLPASTQQLQGQQASVQDLIAKAKMQQQQTEQNAMLAPGVLQQQGQIIQENAQKIAEQDFLVKDREAGMKAMQQWDGKDPNQIPDLIKQNGGSLQAVMNAKAAVVKQQTETAAMTKAQLDNNKQKNDYLLGKLQSATDTSVPDGELAGSVMQATNDAIKDGYLDPQHAQEMQQLVAQFPNPADLRSHLALYEKSMQSQSEQFAQANKTKEEETNRIKANADSIKNVAAGGTLVNTQTGEQTTPTNNVLTGPMADSKYRNILMQQSQGKPISDDDKAYLSAYAKQKELVPTNTFNLQNVVPGTPPGAPLSDAVINALGAEGAQLKLSDVLPARAPASVRQAALNQVLAKYPNYNSGNFAVEQKVNQQYTSGDVGKQLLAINTAREHMKTFKQLADALNNSDWQTANKLGNAFGMEFGSDKQTNFNIAAQALGGEMGRALDGAGVVAGEREQAQKNYNAAFSKGQFGGGIQTMDTLLAGKQKAAQDTYNIASKTGKPNFGGAPGVPQQTGGGASSKPGALPPPAAGITRIQASDGATHDIPSANLERAKKRDPGLKVQ